MDAWRWMTATDLGQGIARNEIDPVDLTETYLEAIKTHPEADRIYTVVTQDRARAEARAARDRAQSGQRLGPLDGVPVSWKDLFDTSGIATEAGTALMEGRVPDSDAEVLVNATAAGLVCLGKTHMSEIAFSGLGLNPITATPPNLHDPEVVPGGSSSGAAASVAHGLAAAAVGSDTGGSVRIPSAWNDLTGLKTTHGRLSLKGVVPLCLTFDTIGPLCRSVSDCALMLAALEGRPAPDLTGSSARGLRVGILQTVAMEDLREAPTAAFDHAVGRLRSAGVQVDSFEVPELAEAFGFAGPLYTADSYAWWRDRIEAAPDKMFAQILKRIRPGGEVLAADYIAHWARLREIRAIYHAATAVYDAVIVPTAPILPPNVARLLADEDYYVTENLLALRNTRVGNLMDCPGVTLPTGVPSCGVLLNGKPGQEAHLLRVASAVEAALA